MEYKLFDLSVDESPIDDITEQSLTTIVQDERSTNSVSTQTEVKRSRHSVWVSCNLAKLPQLTLLARADRLQESYERANHEMNRTEEQPSFTF